MTSIKGQRALLVIDMSVEQVANLSYRKNEIINTIRSLVENRDNFFSIILDSRLCIANNDQSSLPSLYPDVGREGTKGAELLPQLQTTKSGKSNNMRFVKKYNYSSFVDSEVHEILRENCVQEVYLTGINTDYCIFATALDAFYLKYQVRNVEEAVSSVLGKEGHRQGLAQITKFLGEDCIVASR